MVSDTMNTSDPARGAIRAWIAYDFINSLLIINGSLYFSKWISIDQGQGSFWYGLTYSLSAFALLVIAPLIGAAIDRKRNGFSFLVYGSFALGMLALAITGLGHREAQWLRIGGTLMVFGLINFVYQLSLVPYNWLLPHIRGVHDLKDVTKYTGFGEAAGSFGSVIGALLGAYLLRHWLGESADGRLNLLAVMGVVFLVRFVVVFITLGRGTDAVAITHDDESKWSIKRYFHENWLFARKAPRLTRYLLAFMLYSDALLTVQLFLPIYLRERIGFSDSQTAVAFAIALTCGSLSSAAVGWLRPQPLRKIIVVTLILWLGAFAALAVATQIGLLIWSTIVCCGILFGVLWSTSRAYLFDLAERTTLGKGYGLYSVFERCASIIGPLCWSGVMLLPFNMGLRYALAYAVMGTMIVIGLMLLLDGRQGRIDRLIAGEGASLSE